MNRRLETDGPKFRFVYLWSGLWPYVYDFDLSGTGCVQTIRWERIAHTRNLDSGKPKTYMKGWRISADLFWAEGSLIARTNPEDSFEGRNARLLQLLHVADCNQNIFYWPHPGVHPTEYYDVNLVGDCDFGYVRGGVGLGYRGTIRLVGREVRQEIPWHRYQKPRLRETE